MILPSTIPPEKKQLLETLVASLAKVPNLAAVVLGGSYAGGTQHSASDLDIGVYYAEAAPFAIDDIGRVAQSIARAGTSPTVTGLYEWGAWVNGGAWIETEAGKVDFLYRNLDQVQRTIAAAQQGIVQHDYDQQPSNGYYSVGYLAETNICLPLYDPAAQIAGLKRSVTVYPPLLKQKVVADSLWAVEFTLLFARNDAAMADVYNTVGCLVRAAANLTQALFALNERYFLSDKKVMQAMAAFPLLPAGYVQQVESILAHPGQTGAELIATVARLEAAWRGVVALTGDTYRPRFVLPANSNR